MNARLEAALSSLVTICAIVVAGTFVYQQVTAPRVSAVEAQPPTRVPDWNGLLQGGLRVGPRSAPVQIVEFGDFQCPFCRVFHSAVEQLMVELPDRVSLVYYQYPLPMHRHAEAAARASVCAAKELRFAEMAHELFAKQDSIGVTPWTAFAQSAGILDAAGFLSCMASDSSQARVDADRTLATSLSVRGTPTVVIDGWRFPLPPTLDTLRRVAHEVVAGRSPFPRRR